MPFPPELVHEGPVPLADAFLQYGRECGYCRQRSRDLLDKLPVPIRSLPSYRTVFGGWRYACAPAFDRLPEHTFVVGTPQCPQIEWLFRGVDAAEHRLSARDFNFVLQRLEELEKHRDALAELAPLVHSVPGTSFRYEVGGAGAGNSTVDWDITSASGLRMLLEVKYRTVDLLERLAPIIPALNAGQEIIHAEPPNPKRIFRSIEQKFSPTTPDKILQGAWVETFLRHDDDELRKAWQAMDRSRVHFIILGGWSKSAPVVARPDVDIAVLNEFVDVALSPAGKVDGFGS